MYSLGIDIGSSSVKVSILQIETGKSVAAAQYPAEEMAIQAPEAGFAEQDPELWWGSFLKALATACTSSHISGKDIACIGISYQMHGLVLVNEAQEVLRPSIIWCDSRAVPFGEQAASALGEDYCTGSLLNTPGNFTASKLMWVKSHQPEVYSKVSKWMLPGDYIAMRLSNQISSTASGFSEGVFWDFKTRALSTKLMNHFGFHEDHVPDLVPTFGKQAEVSEAVSGLTGIPKGTPISYRAGDQPNNALSLNVLNPGEVAATAGTSGVIYAVTDTLAGDRKGRVNTFLHVNNEVDHPRNGVLLCINGTGILNSWLRKYISRSVDYNQMNHLAKEVPVGSEDLQFFPFGNGAERVLENKLPGATLKGLDFNRHTSSHLFRAGQEGIVFALKYGFEVLEELGVNGKTIRAGRANMFLSPVFREAFCNTVSTRLELYQTDGAEGAARGAAFGAGFYSSLEQAFTHLACLEAVEPTPGLQAIYQEKYQIWKKELNYQLNK